MGIECVLQSQYFASLEMLRQAIIRCPDSQWNKENIKGKYWNIAYHVLYYVHKNLQISEKEFVPWSNHREQYQQLDGFHLSSKKEPIMDEPYSKGEILEYLEFCKLQIIETLPTIELDTTSGFPWFPFTKLELQIHSIRHIQHHASQLIERLENNDVDWVATI